ncbi:MAG: GNAT family N-acetyltransferase [Pseudooceanicola sp.]|nr:GNAT family N-acetyltransferase [Pseudooceanicola sp.]
MPDAGPRFTAAFAESDADLRAAQALRYDVFVREMGSSGTGVDHARGLECDRFDAFARHLLLRDEISGAVIGVYRLMEREQARAAGGFYSEGEYDLAPLLDSNRRLLELGRSCLHRDYRGGLAMHHLWSALSAHVMDSGIDILFGTASFHGTDIAALAEPLSHLHAAHLAPPDLRVRARAYQRMDLVAPDTIDRKRAVVAIPPLIKAYLRLGGFVGDGAFVDHAFNTTDICLILDTARMTDRQRRLYAGA